MLSNIVYTTTILEYCCSYCTATVWVWVQISLHNCVEWRVGAQCPVCGWLGRDCRRAARTLSVRWCVAECPGGPDWRHATAAPTRQYGTPRLVHSTPISRQRGRASRARPAQASLWPADWGERGGWGCSDREKRTGNEKGGGLCLSIYCIWILFHCNTLAVKFYTVL